MIPSLLFSSLDHAPVYNILKIWISTIFAFEILLIKFGVFSDRSSYGERRQVCVL